MNDITDANGIITWNEIPYGEYQIVETEAPKYKDKDGAVEHYQKLRDPINITLDENTKIELQVENNKSGWIIPATGGMGTILFTVVGLILMAVATFIFFRKNL